MALLSSLLILPLIFIILAPVLAQRLCPAGQIRVNSQCQDCPPGTFREDSNGNRCFPCRPGTFSPFNKARSRVICRQCFEDTFSGELGSTECTPCPAGTRSLSGQTECLACGPGTELGSGSRCRPCERGFYSNGTANAHCEPCPSDLTSGRGATSVNMCRTCPPGRVGPVCTLCPAFTFKPGRQGICEPCPPGHVSPSGATSCTPCPPGTTTMRALIRIDAVQCRFCPPGAVAARGSSVCRREGSPCPRGSFEARNGACITCGNGFFRNKATQTCERCPLGSVSTGGVQERCIVCRDRLIPDSENTFCRCPPGFFLQGRSRCRPCPAGTAGGLTDFELSENPDLRGIEGCLPCLRGFFSSEPGSADCTRCPFGSEAIQEGSTSCRECPEGTAPDFFGSPTFGCVSLETGCPLGFQNGGSFGSVCKQVGCQPGTPAEEIGVMCLKCGAGRFVSRQGECRTCPFNRFSLDGMVRRCTPCTDGRVRNSFNESKCSCNGVEGRVGRGLQGGVCARCPKGTFSDSNLRRFDGPDDFCRECPPGSITDGIGQQRCRRCPQNTFADKSGLTTCTPCPPGMRGNALRGSVRCVDA